MDLVVSLGCHRALGMTRLVGGCLYRPQWHCSSCRQSSSSVGCLSHARGATCKEYSSSNRSASATYYILTRSNNFWKEALPSHETGPNAW